MRRAVYLYVISLCIAAVVAAVGCYVLDPTVGAPEIRASLWFGLLILLGHVAIYGRSEGATQTVAYLPVLAAVAASPTWVTLLVVACATALTEGVAKRELIKKLFNLAKGVLGAAVAVLTFRLSGGIALASVDVAPGFLQSSPAFLAAAATFLLLDSSALAAVVALSTRQSFAGVWRGIAIGIPKDLVAAPLAYLFGRVYLAFGGAGVAWLGLPLVGLRQLYSANWQLKRTNEELLELMVAAIEARDPYTSGHSRRVSQYSRLIAQGMGLAHKVVDDVTRAALLHDVGKMDEKYAPLLRKPSRLTEAEEAVMQTHAARSAELVAKVSSLKGLVSPVRHHHEAWNGTGYPDGLAGERIPLASRIIAFADTIDAMSSERPYRPGLSEDIVRAEIVRCRGTQFDPAIADQVLSEKVWRSLFPEKPAVRTVTVPEITLVRSRSRIRA